MPFNERSEGPAHVQDVAQSSADLDGWNAPRKDSIWTHRLGRSTIAGQCRDWTDFLPSRGVANGLATSRTISHGLLDIIYCPLSTIFTLSSSALV
jgi:hypothetical protein